MNILDAIVKVQLANLHVAFQTTDGVRHHFSGKTPLSHLPMNDIIKVIGFVFVVSDSQLEETGNYTLEQEDILVFAKEGNTFVQISTSKTSKHNETL